MSRRKSYYDTSTGEADYNIRRMLGDEHGRTRKVLLNVIKNELTARQTEIIMLYYVKELSVTEISEICGITPQGVSSVMARARKKIFRYMKYTLKEFL